MPAKSTEKPIIDIRKSSFFDHCSLGGLPFSLGNVKSELFFTSSQPQFETSIKTISFSKYSTQLTFIIGLRTISILNLIYVTAHYIYICIND